jgi:hypothetical protein
METSTQPLVAVPQPRRRLSAAAARIWSGVLAVWGVVTGLAPHVLHHVGPLAGAALLAGAGGKLLFAASQRSHSFSASTAASPPGRHRR